MKYHINGKGDVRPCEATVGTCPLGTPDEHYTTPEAARAAFEEAQSAVPELISRRASESARSFAKFEPREAPMTAEEEEAFGPDPVAEESLPPEEYRDLNGFEVDDLIREEWQEEHTAREHQEYLRRNRWSEAF